MRNWHDLSYLGRGTSRQKAALEAIQQTHIMEVLSDYRPVLAGTIPLNIDVVGSDLDIICESHDLHQFEQVVRKAFGCLPGFEVTQLDIKSIPTCVISFFTADFWFELFAQPLAVEKQNAYRHMDIEARLLEIGGMDAYQHIRALKQSGIKTEPAFARYFHIPGSDPYEALLQLESLTEQELRERVHLLRKD
ncbi:DUF4269 domain-containing protein [Brevibacillus sp. M2.1A]|uniref:DUF4269 domain-containing protein n=1 Tax=Brevibacillus sp. M2.1A TaxID=2738980 RepID=UPI00156A8967|nr:DUF4269 domain-containing protein [Brevibacillus sp. M2.1A]MCC8436757.1 DUF4269 domain-containing protein [Brevibacillus sp. M2.1A]